jgi:hypothetical protein
MHLVQHQSIVSSVQKFALRAAVYVERRDQALEGPDVPPGHALLSVTKQVPHRLRQVAALRLTRWIPTARPSSLGPLGNAVTEVWITIKAFFTIEPRLLHLWNPSLCRGAESELCRSSQVTDQQKVRICNVLISGILLREYFADTHLINHYRHSKLLPTSP